MCRFILALIMFILCGCSREIHVRNKVYSILPLIEHDIRENDGELVFAPEILNPWVQALDTNKVVSRLEIALEEMPQYRRATLWMLKAYAPQTTWERVSARFPDIVVDLPEVEGYGEHQRITEPSDSRGNIQPFRSETNQTSSAAEARR